MLQQSIKLYCCRIQLRVCASMIAIPCACACRGDGTFMHNDRMTQTDSQHGLVLALMAIEAFVMALFAY